MGKKRNRSKSGGSGGGGVRGGRRRRRGRGGNGGDGVKPAPYEEPVELANGEAPPLTPGMGLLELHPNGYGFLRSPENHYARVRSDPFVPGTMIEKFGLREGVMISGNVQRARKQQGPRLREITDVDGMTPEEFAEVKSFD